MEKTYISPDIIVVEMGNNLMDVISQKKLTFEAEDSGATGTVELPTIGEDYGTSNVPESSKDNAFDAWSTWDD